MLARSARVLAKRTPGYVFWRQNTLVELEHAKRNYLMSERPVPAGEIARRMVRVKTRYESATDHHERNLLRGEYKYFSGKLLDLRAARASDMIALLQCNAFFGFWDTAQVDRMLVELLRQVRNLSANELACLFVCLPSLRKQRSEAYTAVASKLVGFVDELALAESIAVIAACDDTVPVDLVRGLLRAVMSDADALTPAQLVEVLDTVSVMPTAVQHQFDELWETVKTRALAGCDELECIDVAVLYTALLARGDCGADSSRRLVDRFLAQAPALACARSTAMMFSAAAEESLSRALRFAQQMEERVLFLATDFTPSELLAVFKVYVTCLVAMTAVVESHTAIGAVALRAELQEARQREASFRHVLAGLSDQLGTLLEGAASYISTGQLVELLEVYVAAVGDLEAGQTASVNAAASRAAAASLLLKQMPQTRTIMRLLAGKLITRTRDMTAAELVRLLELSNDLGPALLPDAVVGAVVQQLLIQRWSLDKEAAAALAQLLSTLTHLRAEHQQTIRSALLPKLHGFV